MTVFFWVEFVVLSPMQKLCHVLLSAQPDAAFDIKPVKAR
jgi:hypothetical protein